MNASASRPNFHIRPAMPDDHQALVALWQAAGSHVELSGRESQPALLRQLARFPDLYLVAVDEDRVIGVVLGSHDGRKGWINRLAVHPRFQRRGVGAALVTACDTAIRAQGIDIVAALVEAENAASAALFRRLGFHADVPVLYFRKLDPPVV